MEPGWHRIAILSQTTATGKKPRWAAEIVIEGPAGAARK